VYCVVCAATSRQDVVVRHDDDESSEQQRRRRQWDEQDVSHLLSVLNNAELSSSCSASQTSCSASLSETSCVADDDAVDSATKLLRDRQVLVTGGDAAPQQTTSTSLPSLLFFICIKGLKPKKNKRKQSGMDT